MTYKVPGSLLPNFTSYFLTPLQPNWSHFCSLTLPSMWVIDGWIANYPQTYSLKKNLISKKKKERKEKKT